MATKSLCISAERTLVYAVMKVRHADSMSKQELNVLRAARGLLVRLLLET